MRRNFFYSEERPVLTLARILRSGNAVVGLLMLSISLLAQNSAPPVNFVPPAPTAAKLFEFQAMQPGMYTGTANVNIPLYTIDFDGWSLPLSLSYHATGVRTNEEAGEVGLGWSLNATAQISRTIQGADDLFEGSSTNGRKGYVYSDAVQFDLEYNDLTGPVVPPSTSYYYKLAVGAGPDTQPDIFNYNFFGYSGSFLLTQKVANDTIKVVKLKQDACRIVFLEPSKTFVITTPSGFRGEFRVKEISTTFSSTKPGYNKDACCDEDAIDIAQEVNTSGRYRNVTSWYLTKITSPNSQSIRFIYDLKPDSTSPYISRSKAFQESRYDVFDGIHICHQTIHEHVYLKQIVDDDIQIDFLMEDREDLRENTLFTPDQVGDPVTHFPVSHALKRYSQIIIDGKDPMSTLHKTITIKQSYFHPEKLDAISNNHKESEFIWLRSRLDRVVIDDQMYRFYYGEGSAGQGLPSKLTTGVDHFGFYNGLNNNSFLGPPEAGQGISAAGCPPINHSPGAPWYFVSGSTCLGDTVMYQEYKQAWLRRVEFNSGRIGVLSKIKYPTGGYTVFEYEPHSYIPESGSEIKFQEIISNEFSGNLAGGTRIKSIKDYDFNDSLLLSKSYFYIDSIELNQSAKTTGKLMTPLYNRYTRVWRDGNPPHDVWGFQFQYETFAGIPGNSSAEGKVIGYSRVHEVVQSPSESYRTTYDYENRVNHVLPWNVRAQGYADLNGLLKQKKMFNANGELVQQVINENYFHELDSIKGMVYSQSNGVYLLYHVPFYLKRTFYVPLSTTTKTPSLIDGAPQPSKGVMSETREITFNSDFLQKTVSSTNSKGQIVKMTTMRPSDYSGSSAVRNFLLSRNIVDPVIEEISEVGSTVVGANANLYEISAENKPRLASTYSYNPALGSFVGSLSGVDFSSTYELKYRFKKYSSIGKPLEYIDPGQLTHSFIWDHNGKLPIVHAVGVGYDSLLVAHQAANGSPNYESTLRDHAYLANAMVSTYAHNPLVGTTKIADPTGTKKGFEFDQYGRMKQTTDNDGNIVSNYQYHYRDPGLTRILEVWPANMDFGVVYACEDTVVRQLLLKNTGDDELHVTVGQPPVGTYYLNPAIQGSLLAIAPESSVTIDVAAGGATGAHSNLFSIASPDRTNTNDPLSVLATVDFREGGNNAEFTPSTTLLVIEDRFVNHPIVITNTGDKCFNIGNVTSTSSNTFSQGYFNVSIPPTGYPLAPGRSIEFNVMCTAGWNENPGIRDFTFTTSAPPYTHVIRVAGPVRQMGLSSLPSLSTTAASSSEILTVSNIGSNSPLVISSITKDRTDNVFTISRTSLTIPAGGSDTLTVKFNPPSADFTDKTVVFTFNSNKTSGPDNLTITAAKIPLHELTVIQTLLNVKPTNQTPSSLITNTGNVDATITSVGVDNTTSFNVVYRKYVGGTWQPASLPYLLVPGASLQVEASTAVSGDYSSASGTITVLHSDGLKQINVSRSPN